MASRRARVKVTPKLSVVRNRPAPPPPVKPTVEESTDNSDTEPVPEKIPLEEETITPVVVVNVAVAQPAEKNFEKVVVEKPAELIKEDVGMTVKHVEAVKPVEADKPAATPATTSRRPRVKVAPNIPGRTKARPAAQSAKVPDKKLAKPVEAGAVTAPVTVKPVVIKHVVAKAAVIQNPAAKADEGRKNSQDSDWEDDEFTYQSVEVDQMSPELSHLISKATAEVVVSEASSPAATGSTVTPASSATSSSSLKSRPGLGKNKFKPNLFPDRRSRNISGPRPALLSPRARTISGSDSEPEGAPGSPAALRAVMSPSAPLLEGLLQGGRSPARARKVTETRGEKERSQFIRRKQEHKRRFMRGVPDRSKMTMFDLIYHNPENGQRMSIEEEEQEKVDSPEVSVAPAAETVAVTELEVPDQEQTGEAMPCPQVKVGINGEIILDDLSLVVETTDAKKAKDFLSSAPVAVVENNRNTATNYGTWSKKRRHVDWSERETLRFYKALSMVGSDFSMMESMFKKRTRQELKLKFKKEERVNNKMVDKCLKERGMFQDLELEDSEEDSEQEAEAERGRRKAAKKRPGVRRRYRNKGYYDSSSGGEEADGETSRSPARKRPREVVRNKRRPPVLASLPHVVPEPSHHAPALPLSGQMAPPMTGVQFPPALLAANPGLVGAKPGSLVVVASPSKTDPGAQLLHVYMVSGKKGQAVARQDRSRSPRIAPTSPRAPSPAHLTLDPAVVRAVDRSRLEREGARSRTVSECEERGREGGSRKRTFSEGSGDSLHTELVRQRFLTGTARSVPGIFAANADTVAQTSAIPNSTIPSSASSTIPNSARTPGLPIARKSRPLDRRPEDAS